MVFPLGKISFLLLDATCIIMVRCNKCQPTKMLCAENHKIASQSEVSVLKLPIKWLRAENVVGRINQMALCWKNDNCSCWKYRQKSMCWSVVKNSMCWQCHQEQHVLKMSIIKNSTCWKLRDVIFSAQCYSRTQPLLVILAGNSVFSDAAQQRKKTACRRQNKYVPSCEIDYKESICQVWRSSDKFSSTQAVLTLL